MFPINNCCTHEIVYLTLGPDVLLKKAEVVKAFQEAKKKEIEEKGAASHYGEHQGITCFLACPCSFNSNG